MNIWVNRISNFIKKEAVLCIALGLAVLSVFWQPVDREYLEYIDWDTLMLLFCLMAAMAGFQRLGVFQRIGDALLAAVTNTRSLLLILCFLPFFFSMFITNDVALITFVPFGMIVLQMCGKEKLVIPLVVLQTIAANMGSSLTPIGNPQNLYLYSKSGAKVGDFLLWMLPYTLVTGICIWLAVLFQKKEQVDYKPEKSGAVWGKKRKFYFISYAVLFLFCLLSVAKVLPPPVLFLMALAFFLVADRKILWCIDYALLGTFIGFFIFIGNLGRLPAFRDFFAGILTGHETLAGVISSQVISNVPAALLLSGFTDKWESLVVGTNLGGLGTLIASMASLISYKQMVRQYPGLKGKYFLYFTLGNVGMLVILLGVYGVPGAF
ncbi:SLC13 family permease [Blautia sp.]|uniref:SLC13 family permease n=1 Tax=Blautia sp. TaxID=1955243 RepID=UPI002E7AACF8|nr:SLC13 family permease [Blautia sp.]MEE0811606.1 SLC13 family permease [Blautia sp.]